MAFIGPDIGLALIDALGLPKNLLSFELRVAVDEIVTVKCEYYPEFRGGDLASILSAYELVRKEPAASTEEHLGFDEWMAMRNQAAHDAMISRTHPLYT